MNTYARFRNYLVGVSQINSSFYADDMLVSVPDRSGWGSHSKTPARLLCAGMLLAVDTYSGLPWNITAAVDVLAAMLIG
ncbi:hypothetical protein FQZ97_735270 [compost metagenome]